MIHANIFEWNNSFKANLSILLRLKQPLRKAFPIITNFNNLSQLYGNRTAVDTIKVYLCLYLICKSTPFLH